MPHEKYVRSGDDLVYTQTISLLDSLTAAPFEVETLDHRLIMIPIDEIVNPQSTKLVAGEGMPICKKEAMGPKRGNLIIKFDIEFPEHVGAEQRKVLKEVLVSQ